MFPGVLALLERSLRVDARALGPHAARFGLMATIYVGLCFTSSNSWMFGAPGLRFFLSIAYLNLAFMTLMGVGYFSTAITEEKEEDTLGLMLMAGISPLGVLLGKSGGRLFQALLLMAIQYPFTMLAVTLGGVTQDQIRAAYLAMFAYMVMLAGLGLLCSTLARNSSSSSRLLTIVLVIYAAIPCLGRWYLGSVGRALLPSEQFVVWIAESCVFLRMNLILSSGFDESMLSLQVMTNLLIGAVGFILAWSMFGLATRDPSSDVSSRGLVTRNMGRIRVFAPGRPRFNAFVWKDFHFSAGGIAGLLIRLAL